MNKILTSLEDERIMVENQTNKLREDVGYFLQNIGRRRLNEYENIKRLN
jgi:hypothetical protein